MDLLKQQITEYLQIKEDIKKITDRKKLLEKKICDTMNEYNVATFELPNGSNLNYQIKNALTLTKEKVARPPKKNDE